LAAISGPFCPHAASTKTNTAVPIGHAAVATTLTGRPFIRRLSIVSIAPAPADDLSDADYETRTREVLAAIEAAADRFLQDDVIDIDAGRTGGLLELAFPNGSKIVVNTQPPLQELWLAAQSGGFHFRRSAAAGSMAAMAASSSRAVGVRERAGGTAAPLRDLDRRAQRRNRSRMLLRSSSLGGVGAALSSRPRLLTPAPRAYSS
jgi:CyaY protein